MIKMKLACLVVLLTCSGLSAKVWSQQERINLKFEQVTFVQLFDLIQQKTNLKFVFNHEDVQGFQANKQNFMGKTVSEILDVIFRGKPFAYEILADHIVVSRVTQEKKHTIKGNVVDEAGLPLPGVSVIIKGTTVGVATDADGNFQLEIVKLEGVVLQFTMVGMKMQEVKLVPNRLSYNVVMQMDAQELGDVVCTGYQTLKKVNTTGSFSTISPQAIELRGSAGLNRLLEGKVPGLTIYNNDVRIRGGSTISEKVGTKPLYIVDGFEVDELPENMDLVERITVLKDAAAASIYGSRAGNGVILVTTKKGKVGEAKFSANASYSISQLMEYPEQTGGRMERWLELKFRRNIKNNYYDWATGKYHVPTSYEDVYRNGNGIYDQFWGNGYWGSPSLIHSLQDSLDPYYNNSTNWWKYAFRRSKVVNANVQAVGGTERFRYMVGLGYYDEQGIMINSGYKRANLISNLTAQFTPKLRMDTRVYLSYVDRTMNRSSSSGSSKHTRYEGLSVNPSQQLTVLPATKELEAEWKKSVLGIKDRTDDYRAMVTAFLEYELLKGLTFSASGNIDYSQSNLNKYTPGVFDEYHHESKSEGNIGRQVMLSSEELLHYNTSVNDVHNIDVLLGVNTNKEQAFSMYGYGLRGVSDDVYYYNPQKVPPVVNHGTPEFPEYAATRYYSSDFTEKRMVSYFGRLGYNYKQRYLLEFTFRRDGSSTFGEGNRWANFPSVAVGWSFSEEPFIKRLTGSWLNWGKIRGSYGKSGQTFTSAYLAHGLMNIMDRNFFGKTGVTTDKPVSPYLTWEKTNQYDLGLDMDMFNYRLNMKLDYYYKYTSSLIYDIPIPGSLYTFGAQVENAMEISNEGLELELQADILRESAVSWRMKFNMARNWNRFEKSYSGKDVVDGDGTLLVAGRPLNGLYVWAHRGYYNSDAEVPRLYKIDGQEIYFNGVATDGISGAVGNYRLLDLDGDGNPDSYYAGSPLPLAHGGWVNELMWKNFDLNVLVNFTIGRKMINNRMGLGFSTQSENGHLTKLFDYRKLRPWDVPILLKTIR